MDSSPLTILQITDLHILSESGNTMSGLDTENTFKQVLKYAYTQHSKVDLTLVTGDLTQNPCQSSYQRIQKELSKYQSRTVCLPGNHDDLSLMQQILTGKQINCDKHILFKHWQIICLNSKKEGSQGGYLATEELDYLTGALQQNEDLNTIIAVHHHPVPTYSPWMDKMIIENSDELFRLLGDYPQVKAIICGHIHQQLEIIKNNILILGTPSSCFQFEPHCTEYTVDDEKPGYRILQLYPNGTIKSKINRLHSV